ncbi:MAG: polysaccharide biosynthesis/export family protein [Cytophagales bacterium]
MFKTATDIINDQSFYENSIKEKNYKIQPNDYIDYTVYTNGGERIIDPNFELRRTVGIFQTIEKHKFLVYQNGIARLPMIGEVKVEGLTLYQLDTLLQNLYNKFYENSYVISKVINKRVFVLGTSSGTQNNIMNGKVIPLENENMTLVEVLALAGGLDYFSKANNIRLIRGDLKNPNVIIIDLSTIEGMQKANLLVQPNDIIYIERYQRKFIVGIQEIASVTTLLLTVFAFYFSIAQFTR